MELIKALDDFAVGTRVVYKADDGSETETTVVSRPSIGIGRYEGQIRLSVSCKSGSVPVENLKVSFLNKTYLVDMMHGETWGVPLWVIAYNHAKEFAEHYGGITDNSLIEGTIPLFKQDSFEIEDWAKNNMNWGDVKRFAKLIKAQGHDYELAWNTGIVAID